MPLSLVLQGSGVRIARGKRGLVYHGKGELWFDKAPRVGIDTHLLDDLKQLVDFLGLRLWVSSIDTGKHVKGSRHYRGLAADVWRIAPAGDEPELVTTDNHWARLVAVTLAAARFEHHEGGPWPAVLLGPPQSELNETPVDHSDHLHISLYGV